MVFSNIIYISQRGVQNKGSGTIHMNILRWLNVSFQATLLPAHLQPLKVLVMPMPVTGRLILTYKIEGNLYLMLWLLKYKAFCLTAVCLIWVFQLFSHNSYLSNFPPRDERQRLINHVVYVSAQPIITANCRKKKIKLCRQKIESITSLKLSNDLSTCMSPNLINIKCTELKDLPVYNFHSPLKPCMQSGPRKRTIVRNIGITRAGSRPWILRPNSCHRVAWKKQRAIYTQTACQAIHTWACDSTAFSLIFSNAI